MASTAEPQPQKLPRHLRWLDAVPGFGMGSVIATMLPYSIAFFFAGTALLLGWIAIGSPIGPGAEAWLPA
jgi:p-aminobenzoyl-glutamate transporter AbgT